MGNFITLSEAAAMTARYRSQREAILKSEYQNQAILPLSETFERAAFDAVLGKSGCSAVRVYFGMTEDLKVHAVIVGVDGSGNDILPPATMMSTFPEEEAGDPEEEDVEEDYIIDRGIRCPDICPSASPLNS